MAKRAKKATIEADQAPPVDKEVLFKEHFEKIRSAKAGLDAMTKERAEANGVYRDTLKAAKSAGLDPDAITWVLAAQKRDPAEVTRRFSTINEYLRLAGVPVGTQLGLFDDGRTVATTVEDEGIQANTVTTEDSIRAAKSQGYDFGIDGKNKSMNPHGDGSPEYLSWDAGYDEGQAFLAAGLARPKRNGRSHEAAAEAGQGASA